jgi:hypothetical protein
MRWMKKRKAAAESAEPREDAESDEEFRQELAGSMGDIVEGVKELAHPPRPPAVRFPPLDHPAGSHFGAPHLGAIAEAHSETPSHGDALGEGLDIAGGILYALLQSGRGSLEVYRRHHKAVHGSASELPQPGPPEQQDGQQRQQAEPDDDDRLGRPSPDQP